MLSLKRPFHKIVPIPSERKGYERDEPEVPTQSFLGGSRLKTLLWLGDILVLNVTLLLAILASSRYSGHFNSLQWKWFLSYVALWTIVALVYDLFDLQKASRRFYSAYVSGKMVALTSIIYFLIPHLSVPLSYSRSLWVFLVTISTVGICLWRYLFAVLMPMRRISKKALILGAGKAGEIILKAIDRNGNNRYKIVGFVDDREDLLGTRVGNAPVLGSSSDLLRIMESTGAREVILAYTQNLSDRAFRSILDIQERGWQITPMTALYEDLTGSVPVDYIGKHVHLLTPPIDFNGRPVYEIWKRGLDIFAGVIGVLFTGILIPFLWLANRIFSPGPLFYRQRRIGEGGKPFNLLKFRSMVPNAEVGTGAVWTSEDDKRITKLGRILRKTHIDELPQFWNVLKGEMSLIGPRPERPEFVKDLDRKIPFFCLRHSVKPGLTGWAQVHLGYINSVEGTIRKIQYDLYYIKHRSFYLDLLILFKTFREIIGLNGT